MKMMESQFAWNAVERGGDIRVGVLPDLTGWTDRYDCTGGFCYTDRLDMMTEARIAMLFIDFNQLVVGCRLDPQKVHAEFMKIDEYRKMIPPDWPGSDQDGGFAACHSIRGI